MGSDVSDKIKAIIESDTVTFNGEKLDLNKEITISEAWEKVGSKPYDDLRFDRKPAKMKKEIKADHTFESDLTFKDFYNKMDFKFTEKLYHELDRSLYYDHWIDGSSPYARRGMNDWGQFWSKVTYKPTFRFSWRDWNGRDYVRIVMYVEDTYNRGRMTEVYGDYPTGKWVDEETACLTARKVIAMIEQHESDEWFKFDGKMVFDPHDAKNGHLQPKFKEEEAENA